MEVLDQFCRDYGVTVNNDKTKFFVINGEDGDADAIHVNSLAIEHCLLHLLRFTVHQRWFCVLGS